MKLGVYCRPYLKETLERCHKDFNLELFTSSNQQYADLILKTLDPDSTYFKRRWYRHHCTLLPNTLFFKDLSLLQSPLSRTVLVDNSSLCFGGTFLNGIPILPYWGKDSRDLELGDIGTDTELEGLCEYLSFLDGKEDVREANWKYFRYGEEVITGKGHCN